MAFSLSEEQLQTLAKNYEWGRKLRMIEKKDRLMEVFDTNKIFEEMKKSLLYVERELKPHSQLLVAVGIEWNKRRLNEKQWRKYNSEINILEEAWREFSPISVIRRDDRAVIGYN